MITGRPKFLVDDKKYQTLPNAPFEIDWTSIPALMRDTIRGLGGIQPVTQAMATASEGTLCDQPSDSEVELFRERGTKFQMVLVVLSCVEAGKLNNRRRVRPFAVTLIPASKGGTIQECTIDMISDIDVANALESDFIYSGYNPFSGEWSLFGVMPGYLDGKREGYFDEIGLVVDQFFLATQIAEDDEVLTTGMKMPTELMGDRYEKHRKKLFFTPFEKIEARRVWGAETPIELFLIQALAREELFPQCQILIMDDGATFPSTYDLWQDLEFRHSEQLVTETDLFFPDKRVAVFCDGGHHNRAKVKSRDSKINRKLESLGIRWVRVAGDKIRNNLPDAVEIIKATLSS